MLARPRAVVVLSLILLSAACDGGTSGGEPLSDGMASAPPIGSDVSAALPVSALDGLAIRRIGLVRFDVIADTVADADAKASIGIEATDDEDFGLYPAPVAYTEGRASFTALDTPLDAAELARVAALGEPAIGCFAVGEESSRSLWAHVRAAGEPMYAGEVLTVSRQSGSWFELHGAGEAAAGYRHVGARDGEPGGRLAGGAVRDGTVLDVPGGAFPAFASVAVPPMEALTGIGWSAVELTWDAGADPGVPLVVDISFSGFVSPKQSAERSRAAEGAARVPYPASELPGAIRCVAPDTGRFVLPEAVRDTIREARALSTGSATVGERVEISRLVTRYRVAGDALLIVQSGNGEAP